MLRVAFATSLFATALPAQQVPIGPDVVTPDGRAADSVLAAAATGGFAGVVYIRRGGTVLLRRGYGLANRAKQIAFGPGTVVQIGSNTKDFTKVAVLQLAGAGKLRLSDSLGAFFANVPADKRGITVRHLLDHTAGFPLGIGGDYEPVSKSAFIARAMATPLNSAPGTTEKYSNTGYALLAAIIEARSGQTYDEYLQSHLFTPLGMRHTGLLLPKFRADDLAHGVEAGKEQPTMLERPHAADGSHWNLRGNGGLLSTVDDMVAFYDALFGTEQLLPRAVRQDAFPDGPVVLAGSDMIDFFVYDREPMDGLVMVLASNVAEQPAPRVHRALLPLYSKVAMGGPGPRLAPNAPAVTLPDSPAGRAAKEWLQTMMHADSVTIGRFLSERMAPSDDKRPLGERVAQALSRRGRLVDLVPVRFEEKSPAQIVVHCRTGEGDPATLTFDIEAAAPFRILGVRMMIGD